MTDCCDTTFVHQEVVQSIQLDGLPVGRVADVFKVLADETRLKIVYVLNLHELCVCDIAALLGSTQSNISHHLRVLRSARLVKHRRDGKMVYYSLDDDHVRNMIQQGFAHIAHQD